MAAHTIKFLLAASLACIAWAPALAAQDEIPADYDAKESGRFANGLSFPFHYVVIYWQDYPIGVVPPENPNDAAPGVISDKPDLFVHGKLPPKDVALIERKLRVAFDALMALPSFKDIRGASLLAGINMERGRSGRIQAKLTFVARPLSLRNPDTRQHDGRYYTPGEGAVLNIGFNIPLLAEARDERIFPYGKYNGNELINGEKVAVPLSQRPLTIAGGTTYEGQEYSLPNPDFFDPALPQTQLQLLTGEVRYASFNKTFSSQARSETDYVARLIGALYMADWNDIARRMEQVR